MTNHILEIQACLYGFYLYLCLLVYNIIYQAKQALSMAWGRGTEHSGDFSLYQLLPSAEIFIIPPTLDFYTPPLSFHAKPFFFVPHNSKMVLLDTITTFYLIFFFFSNSFKNNKIFWDYILHYNQYYAINVTYHSLKLNPLYVHM